MQASARSAPEQLLPRLLVDIGNSCIKLCQTQGKGLSSVQVFDTLLTWQQALERWCDQYPQGTVYLACVRDALNRSDVEALLQMRAQAYHWCSLQQAAALLPLQRYAPGQLGIDRCLVMLAARQRYPQQACVIIDAGSATTVDYIDALGEYGGGWILPGRQLMARSLAQLSPKLHRVDDYVPGTALTLGLCTAQAVDQGILACQLGAITLAMQQVQMLKADSPVVLVVTGGLGQSLLGQLEQPAQYIPLLLFEGLALYSQAVPVSD